MRRVRLRSIPCWLAAAATVVNATAAAAGVVRCAGPQGQVALEAGCAHDHCEADGLLVRPSAHDHDRGEDCVCAGCECEDTAVGKEIAAVAKRGLEHPGVPAPTLHVIGYAGSPARGADRPALVAPEALSPPDGMLRVLRTVVLLI